MSVYPLPPNENGVMERAVAAHHKRSVSEGAVYQKPDAYASAVEQHGSEDFAVLRNVKGALAVYVTSKNGEKIRYVEPENWPDKLKS